MQNSLGFLKRHSVSDTQFHNFTLLRLEQGTHKNTSTNDKYELLNLIKTKSYRFSRKTPLLLQLARVIWSLTIEKCQELFNFQNKIVSV